MDPTILIIIASVLAGGGVTGAAVAAMRRRRRRRLSRRLKEERLHDGRELSLFDVFWDLGASDFALELMRHNGVLPEAPDDVDRAHERLDGLVEHHEGYDQFVDDSLEAIEEFYEATVGEGSRREIPTLETRARKLLPVDESGAADSSFEAGALVPRDRRERDLGEAGAIGGYVDRTVEEKQRMRETHRVPGGGLRARPTAPGSVIDVDDISDFDPSELLSGIVEGRFTEKLQEWWERRRLRSLKSRLDEQFESLYDFYVEQVDRIPDFYGNLFDTADKWRTETQRIARIRRRQPLEGQPERLAAELLLELAEETADAIARRVELETTQTIERIHGYARDGDFAMAGYLLYLNRHAFFAGRAPEYGEYARRIENTAHKVKSEIRQLEA